jgi:integrase/recombinase XerC
VQNSSDNVFDGIAVGKQEAAYFTAFLDGHDFSANSRRAFTQDIRKFAGWFSSANREPFTVGRVTTRDVADFRDHLRREQGQAVATVNRALVTVRRFFTWLTEQGTSPRTRHAKSRKCGESSLHRKVWIVHRCAGCYERLNCGRTFERRRSSRSCCIPAAVLVTS